MYRVIKMFNSEKFPAPIYRVWLANDRFAEVTFQNIRSLGECELSVAYIIPRKDGTYVFDQHGDSHPEFSFEVNDVIQSVYKYMRGGM